ANGAAEVAGAVDEPEVALVEVGEDTLLPERLDQRFVLAQALQVRDDRLIRDDKRCPVAGALDRRLDALLEVREQVACVPAEDLAAALSAKHDLPFSRGIA